MFEQTVEYCLEVYTNMHIVRRQQLNFFKPSGKGVPKTAPHLLLVSKSATDCCFLPLRSFKAEQRNAQQAFLETPYELNVLIRSLSVS